MSGFFRAQSPVDLHLHSTVSDGTDSPTEVVRAAHAAGVRTMSLTDHDKTDGWHDAIAECAVLGMTFIPGTELSVSTPNAGGMHLLAYMFDPLDPALSAAMRGVTDGKENRVREIVGRLSPTFDITFDEVLDVAAGAPPQRPHIATVLVKHGYATDVTDAIQRILSSSSPYYVPTPKKPDVLQAIELVRHAGGVPILAHPCARTQNTMPKHHLQTMLEAGLGGLELDHQENRGNNPEALATLWEYHREFDFIVTGSSDYHGANKVNQPGDDTTSEEMLQRLIESARGSSGAAGSEPVFAAAQ
jgi:predicted metal-dependent phosphoesterase TrpH